MITDRNDALDRLRRDLQPTICPTLSDPDLDDLLNAVEICSVWTATTLYEVGDYVVPTSTARNGHKYRCIGFVPGGDNKTAATEPSWLGLALGVSSLLAPGVKLQGRIVDGSVIWEESGAEVDFWDLQMAAYNGWMLKASKASPKTDFTAGGTRVSLDQQYQHCINQANRFLPVGVA